MVSNYIILLILMEMKLVSFYKDELQKITADPTGVYKIEKVLRHRKYKGKKQFLVRWLFWPPKYDTWVDASELSTL